MKRYKQITRGNTTQEKGKNKQKNLKAMPICSLRHSYFDQVTLKMCALLPYPLKFNYPNNKTFMMPISKTKS